MRPLCACGNLAKKNGLTMAGKQMYYNMCSSCLKRRNKQGIPGARGGQRRSLRDYKKDHCEKCGFVAAHSCQLDVDHIGGSRANNDLGNFQTLCANCHRLKTFKNKDWESKKPQ